MNIPSIKNIVTKDFILIFFSILFFVSPGIAVIMLYFPEWLSSFDSLKLILISCVLSTPVVSILWMESSSLEGETFHASKDHDAFINLFLSIFLSAIVIYGALALTRWFETYMGTPHKFTWLVAVIFVFLIAAIYMLRFEYRRKK